MGDVVDIQQYRPRRSASAVSPAGPARFYFDLACPFSYIASERVEGAFASVVWAPAAAAALGSAASLTPERREQTRSTAERRAASLRLPLVWPELWPAPVPRAMRAAAYAAEVGRGAPFALAAARLAFCGGFDLETPEALCEAAAAAGLDPDACLVAARDSRRDEGLAMTSAQLAAHGASRLPVLEVGGVLFCGEQRVAEAAAAARCGLVADRAL
jgi:2-hydroxychromene-2-carboxylate isomerase